MRSPGTRQERGVALIAAIIALLLVTAVAGGMILLSNTETNVDANYRDEQVAIFAAKAGLEEARDRLLASNPNPISAPTALPGSAGGALYITASGVSPWSSSNTKYGVSTYDKEFMSELTAAGLTASGTWYASTSSSSSYSGPSTNPLPYQWVRINLKLDASAAPYSVDGNSSNKAEQVCYDTVNLYEVVISAATCSAASTNYEPVYEITSLAITPSGTQRMLQQEVTQQVQSPIPPGTLSAALTIDGPVGSTPCGSSGLFGSGSTCNGSGDYINGNTPSGTDSNIAACTPPSGTNFNVPAIAATDAADQATLSTALAANKSNIVGSTGSPSVGTVSASALGTANLNTVSGVEAFVSKMEGLAGSNVGPSCSSLNLGTASSPTIAVVTNATGSACSLNSGTTGYGILVVTGTLDYVNVNSYQGIILMLGTAQFISSSSKDTTLTGALFMAQDLNPSTGAPLAGPGLGTPSFNFHHGNASASDVSIQYDQCIVNQVESKYSTTSNYFVLSQRELAF
jgi:hypothetical protein